MQATARYTPEGLIVLRDSSAPLKANVNAALKIQPWSTIEKRDRYAKGVIAQEGERFVFQRDYLFQAPSGASSLLCRIVQRLGGLENRRRRDVTNALAVRPKPCAKTGVQKVGWTCSGFAVDFKSFSLSLGLAAIFSV